MNKLKGIYKLKFLSLLMAMVMAISSLIVYQSRLSGNFILSSNQGFAPKIELHKKSNHQKISEKKLQSHALFTYMTEQERHILTLYKVADKLALFPRVFDLYSKMLGKELKLTFSESEIQMLKSTKLGKFKKVKNGISYTENAKTYVFSVATKNGQAQIQLNGTDLKISRQKITRQSLMDFAKELERMDLNNEKKLETIGKNTQC